LADHGYRISRIALMTPEHRAREVENLACQPKPDESVVLQQMLRATISLDEFAFEHALQSIIDSDGLEDTMLRIIYPFMERIGILWQTGSINPAQEHLITNLIRQKVIVALDRMGAPKLGALPPDARRFVLYLPETELHELALLFMHYLLRVRGHRVVYLGQNLPTKDLKQVCGFVQPHYILTVLTVVPERDNVAQYIASLAKQHPDVELLLYGAMIQMDDLPLPPTARTFRRMDAFIGWLNNFSSGQNAI
jgi:MerR family transcriptional regulator, light-induced transcriptional regulator